nr:hypothetical protein [uncultured Sphaerochaeta sp.]
MGPAQIDAEQVTLTDPAKTCALPQPRPHAHSAGRGIHLGSGQSTGSGQDVPEVYFLVESPHANNALVPSRAGQTGQSALKLDFGHSIRQYFRYCRIDQVQGLRRHFHLPDFEIGFDRTNLADKAGSIRYLKTGQGAVRQAAEQGHRQHVQFQPNPVEAAPGMPIQNVAEFRTPGHGLNPIQGCLFHQPIQRGAAQNQGIALHGSEYRFGLSGPAKVDQIGVLEKQTAVHPMLLHEVLKVPMPAHQFGSGRMPVSNRRGHVKSPPAAKRPAWRSSGVQRTSVKMANRGLRSLLHGMSARRNPG